MVEKMIINAHCHTAEKLVDSGDLSEIKRLGFPMSGLIPFNSDFIGRVPISFAVRFRFMRGIGSPHQSP